MVGSVTCVPIAVGVRRRVQLLPELLSLPVLQYVRCSLLSYPRQHVPLLEHSYTE